MTFGMTAARYAYAQLIATSPIDAHGRQIARYQVETLTLVHGCERTAYWLFALPSVVYGWNPPPEGRRRTLQQEDWLL